MFRILVLLPILSAVAQQGLVARQASISDCTAPCQALADSLNAGNSGDLAAICTNTVVNNYATCYNCEVKFAGMTEDSAQEAVDAYVAGCKAGGSPVNGITVSGAGSAAAGGTGGSDSSPAATGSSGSSGAPPSGKTGGAARTSTGLAGLAYVLLFFSFAAW
ncbi:hypothetical protein C8R43DRAFT_84342 [Mycena crocata]|nr:hypothetical protein C8R43DRAFT_84342 [Mycena crocata]